MKVSFFLPKSFDPPEEQKLAWEQDKIIPIYPFARVTTYHFWIYQTWMLLRRHGLACDLVHEMPREGIVIVHGDWATSFLYQHQHIPKELFLVEVVADELPNPLAHFHLVQNRLHARLLKYASFMPHWPQPDLLPRDPERGDRFSQVAFIGYPENLDASLRTAQWQAELNTLGLTFVLPDSTQWYDYRQFDAVIAIRDFSQNNYFYKPASKLYNAWLAGVPFIGGHDSAFKEDGVPGKNYLIATSVRQLLEKLKQLKEDLPFRHALVAAGCQAATSFSREATLERWRSLVEEGLPKLAETWWQKSKWQKYFFIQRNRASCFSEKLRRHPRSWLKKSPFYQKYTIAFDAIAERESLCQESQKIQEQYHQALKDGDRVLVKASGYLLSAMRDFLFYKDHMAIFQEKKMVPLPTKEATHFFSTEMDQQNYESRSESHQKNHNLERLSTIMAYAAQYEKLIDQARSTAIQFYQEDLDYLAQWVAFLKQHLLPILEIEQSKRSADLKRALSAGKRALRIGKELIAGRRPDREYLVVEGISRQLLYWEALSFKATSILIEHERAGKLYPAYRWQRHMIWARRAANAYRKALDAAHHGQKDQLDHWQEVAVAAASIARREIFFTKVYCDVSISYLWVSAARYSYWSWLFGWVIARWRIGIILMPIRKWVNAQLEQALKLLWKDFIVSSTKLTSYV